MIWLIFIGFILVVFSLSGYIFVSQEEEEEK
jgi:uncharacterized membrane protein